MNTIAFEAFFSRVKAKTAIASQMDLARALKVNRSAITQAKNRNAVPQKWILALSRLYGVSPDWLEFGGKTSGPPSRENMVKSNQPFTVPDVPLETVRVPKVRAVLCAGGGSFELDAVPVSEHPFPRSWLARMGSPNDMVFMDVIGNSMEPGICDGDMVLVDQSIKDLVPKSVLAVGFEDAIFIKRLERRAHGFVMLSDNEEYAPVEIVGDELDSFRVIGRVVWLCRDCRYA
jgi:Predicted transcriptional regulator